MSDVFMTFFNFLHGVLKWVCIIGGFAVLPFVLCVLGHFLYNFLAKHKRLKQHCFLGVYRHRSLFLRLFWDFPRRFALDMFDRDPDAFPYCGIVMIVGEQGAGKTTCAAHMLRTLHDKFPKVKILSNTPLSFADGDITSPDDIIFCDNGSFGCIKFLDEIHSWFNSSESQYFPPEMLSEISQQRKQHSLIVGTAQRFDRVSKAIRQQTHYIIKPVTLCGCFTVCRVYKPRITDTGEIVKLRGVKTYCFVHDDELRNAFDTYAKIKRLSVKGWKPRTEQLSADNDLSPIINVDVKKLKK